MGERVEPVAAPVAAYPRLPLGWSAERREYAVFVAATVAVWGHTLDEVRIGELIALPFGVANAALVAAWPRLRAGWRAAASIAFGLLWGMAVVPYHVAPLLAGAVTWQNLSGVSRLVGGAAMVAVGVAILRRWASSGPRR